MGAEIRKDQYGEAERTKFKQRLRSGLGALESVLQRPAFGVRPRSIGVELELFLVDENSRALPVAAEVVRSVNNASVTPEIGRIDIELSTPPVAVAGEPFSKLRKHMSTAMTELDAHAAKFGARTVPVSILPTLRRDDFGAGNLTDLPRYRALARGLQKGRSAPFEICISGDDPLQLSIDDATMESANTAFQIHMSVAPDEFARMFNAALMITAPVLAAAGNSPTFLGHRLWHETRIALFKQAGDDRPPESGHAFRLPSRFGFGNGWVREGAHELFAESVALHEPLLYECHDEEDAEASARAGCVPTLWELRLHHGTVWRWNRPVYNPSGTGHLRIELRALPAGPSVDDMLANAAFFIGSILAFAPRVDELLPAFPFALAERNFYRAAQFGLDAELAWPVRKWAAPEAMSARDVLLLMLPHARQGLATAGVASSDADHFLGLFEERVRSGTTGAVWQRRVFDAQLARGVPRASAAAQMLERYMSNMASAVPVAAWPL